MEENIKYIIINEYNELNEIEGYKVIEKPKLIFFKVITSLISLATLGQMILLLNSIYYRDDKVETLMLVLFGLLVVTVVMYIVFNLAKIHVRMINKKFDLKGNKPNKYTFYNSYLTMEKSTHSINCNMKINYTDMKKVYILKNIYIFESKKIAFIVYKDEFELGDFEEFNSFLETTFKEKLYIKY